MSEQTLKLLTVLSISGQIEVKTGLHIGTEKGSIEIGGMDNPVVKHPVTREPYIPGSSLKGKMRSLLELKYEKTRDGDVCSCGDGKCFVCTIFGTTASNSKIGPTRIIVRDAKLNKDETKRNLSTLEDDFSPYEVLEEKWENVIDRLLGRAKSPRQMERVVPGTIFDFEIIYRIFEIGDGNQKEHDTVSKDITKNEDVENIKYLKEALELLEEDYLGGSGSRGYGKVRFYVSEIKCDEEKIKEKAEELFKNFKKP